MTRTLVVCCDGTWNTSDQKHAGKADPTNVYKLSQAVAEENADGAVQHVYYQKGVGTGRFDRLSGGLFGWGLSRHVQDAYQFIVQHYEEGDAIFLFGFSRGAFTARSTAGLIRNCGVLRSEHKDQLGAAYALYRRGDAASHPTGAEAQRFREKFAYEACIHFIGVWDTVGELGIPTGIPGIPSRWLQRINRPWAFHDVKLSSYVDKAYHALSIDERRKQFVPTLWEQQPHAHGQTMEQVWFAGVHSNVGGSYPDSGLSDITLRWMTDKATACGLAFKADQLEQARPDCAGTLYDSRSGFFKLLRGADRCMHCKSGTSDVTAPEAADRWREFVHPSAVERMERDLEPRYRPQNLRNYLKREGPIALP